MKLELSGHAPLHGLVLAGGWGRRLGHDKGLLEYHGRSQVRWLLDLIQPLCTSSFVSIRAEQAELAGYRGLPAIIDPPTEGGPANGLMAALQQVPGAAWLIIAADMPLLQLRTLKTLVTARDVHRLATAYRHRNGVAEPLCSIWEPMVGPILTGLARSGTVSLRRLLESGSAKLIQIDDDEALCSVNTAAEDLVARQILARRSLETTRLQGPSSR